MYRPARMVLAAVRVRGIFLFGVVEEVSLLAVVMKHALGVPFLPCVTCDVAGMPG